jgi:beta-glucanase (GH16 family)
VGVLTAPPRHVRGRGPDRASVVTTAVLVVLAVAALITGVSTARPATPSGRSMPVGNLAGWEQVFADDFTTPVAEGDFADSVYADRWSTYDGFADTAKFGVYSNSGLSVRNGSLDMDIRTVDGIPRAAAVVPLVGGQWGGQTYGRFSVRMRSDAIAGYGAGFLLWSDANEWTDGEVDFPEGSLDGTVYANNHCPGDPEEKCVHAPVSGIDFQHWHTYTIDWTPDLLAFEVDGRVVAKTTVDIPTKPLHWVMQVGTVDHVPAASAKGDVQIDWATIYRYSPSTVAAPTPSAG